MFARVFSHILFVLAAGSCVVGVAPGFWPPGDSEEGQRLRGQESGGPVLLSERLGERPVGRVLRPCHTPAQAFLLSPVPMGGYSIARTSGG